MIISNECEYNEREKEKEKEKEKREREVYASPKRYKELPIVIKP